MRAQRRDNVAAWLLEVCRSLGPISSHFIHFLCVTGTLPAVALVVNPRVGGWVVYILSLCRPFKQTILKSQQFLSLVFTARSYEDLCSLHWNPGLCGLVWGWDCSPSRCFSKFLPTTCGCGITCSGTSTAASPHHSASPCLIVHLRDSAPPTCMNECGFFKSLVVGLPYSLIFLTVLVVICFEIQL